MESSGGETICGLAAESLIMSHQKSGHKGGEEEGGVEKDKLGKTTNIYEKEEAHPEVWVPSRCLLLLLGWPGPAPREPKRAPGAHPDF